MPAWAMTSIISAVKWSAEEEADVQGLGLSIVGPKTVAKLWRDILLWVSYWFTLERKKRKRLETLVIRNQDPTQVLHDNNGSWLYKSTYITKWSIKKLMVFWFTEGIWEKSAKYFFFFSSWQVRSEWIERGIERGIKSRTMSWEDYLDIKTHDKEIKSRSTRFPFRHKS